MRQDPWDTLEDARRRHLELLGRGADDDPADTDRATELEVSRLLLKRANDRVAWIEAERREGAAEPGA